jgi:heat shock protein HtpX
VSRSGGIACPECGADNSPGAAVCRLCGALLHPGVNLGRRLQRKILHRTDFVGAARENERRTRKRRGMEGAKHRAEEPAIGARRRAQQPTHRAVESLWERAGPRLFVARRADAGRIAGIEELVAGATAQERLGCPVAHSGAPRRNRLIALLLVVTAALGYLIGWNVQLLAHAAPSPPGRSVWFLSGWGIAVAVALFCIGAGWAAVAIRVGDRVVLSLTGAKEVSPEEQPQLHNVVEEMAVAAGLPKPRVYVLQTDAMNAFATGLSRRRSAVCATTGLLRQLNREELQGVIGHELGHVVNLDVRYATAVAVIVGLVALVSDGVLRSIRYGAGRSLQRSAGRRPNALGLLVFAVTLLFALAAPLFVKLVQMAVSRQREFLADATSVRLTRNPAGLISALEKLSAAARPFKGVNRATQHMFIVNPLRTFSDTASALMATHPPIERRVRRLRYLGPRL